MAQVWSVSLPRYRSSSVCDDNSLRQHNPVPFPVRPDMRQPVFPGSQRIGSKRTVQTSARAKRYADIQTVSILIIQPGKQCPLTLCNGNRQIDFLIGCQIGLFHIGSNLFFCFSLIKHLHRNLRRTDTGQCTPWQRLSRLFLQQAVQMFLQCILCLCTIGKSTAKVRSAGPSGASSQAMEILSSA